MENRIDQLKYYISVLQNILKEFRMNTNVETIIKSYESKKAEKFIQLNTKKYSNETRVTIGRHNHWEKQPWLTPEQALAAVEIAREELIEWLEENIDKYIYITGEFAKRKMFEDFRKALEE